MNQSNRSAGGPRVPRRQSRAHFPTESHDTAVGFEQHRRWDKILFDAGLLGDQLAGEVRRP